jgi:hypothetical protein
MIRRIRMKRMKRKRGLFPSSPRINFALRSYSVNVSTTPMDKAELSAWESAKGIVDDMTDREWTDLEDFYAAPQEKTYARKSLATLLNNLSGELDKAANWSQQHTNAQRKLSKPTIWN